MVCIRCQKRPAIIFVQRMENGQMKNEGYCLHCAREMHIKPVDDLMKQFGMSDEDMDAMEDRMENMMQEMGDMSSMNPFSMMMGMGQPDQSEEDGDLVPGSSATFPLGVNGGAQNGKNEKKAGKNEKKPPRRKFLDTYCENLTRKAREGKLDDIIGRDREIYRTIQILSRRQKNNPCLIGEAGVGKTAIAEGIAERIAKGQVPAGLQDKEIFLLDLTSLVAGTQFRGQFEQRVKGLLSEVKAAGNVILFIDEIHTITSAGESEGAMNAGNILKPALSRGEIQVIGATTFTEYRKYIEKDQALERRFQPVRVEEPSVADTLAVMNGIKRYYEQHHHVQVPAEVLSAVVTLSERYITDRFLPDKAIDLLDEACACCNLAHPVISEYLGMQKELDALKQEEADMETADVNEPIDYERVAERKTRIAKLEAELPGILNWALEGLRKWLANSQGGKRHGLPVCPAVDDAVNAYKQDQDRIAAFLADCTEPAPGQTVQASVLFRTYLNWCADNNEKWRMANKQFGVEVKKHCTIRKGRYYFEYVDLALSDEGLRCLALNRGSEPSAMPARTAPLYQQTRLKN